MIIVGFLNNSLYYATFNLLSILFENFTDPKMKQERSNISKYCLLFNFLTNIAYWIFFQNISFNLKLIITILTSSAGGGLLILGIKQSSLNLYIFAASFVGIG